MDAIVYVIANNAFISGEDRGTGPFVPFTDFAFSQTITDPLSTFELLVEDPGSTTIFRPQQTIVLIDETGLANPTHNLLINPSLNHPVETALGGAYATDDAFPLVTITELSPGVQFQANNQALGGDGFLYQQLQNGYITPGVKYMLSGYENITATCSGCHAILKWNWVDGAGNFLSAGGADSRQTTGGQIRLSMSATAPAGAVSAIIYFGLLVDVAGTNSGTVQFTTLQFEPMWFTSKGVSYPTPDCNGAQPTCYVLPDATTVRQTRVFAGYIVHTERTYDGNDRHWILTCNSLSRLLETFYLANVDYNSTYDSVIINNIIVNNYLQTYTGTFGTIGSQFIAISTNHVVQGVLIDSLSVADQNFREVLQTITNTNGFYAYVDHYFDLHHAPPGYEQAQFGLSDTPNAAPIDGSLPTYSYEQYKLEEDGTQKKSRVTVLGGKFIAPAVTDTLVATSNGQTLFTLNNPQPHTVSSCSANSVTQVVGVAGVNKLGAGSPAYTALLDKGKAQLKLQTGINSGQSVVITYNYEAYVKVRCRDLAAIAADNNQIFDGKVNDTALNSTTSAAQRGIAELESYSTNRQIVTLTTQQALAAGQMVQLTSSHDSYAKFPVLVQKVDVKWLGAGVVTYACTLGAYNPSLTTRIANIHRALARSTTTASAPILEEHLVVIDTLTYSELELIVLGEDTFVGRTVGAGWGTASSGVAWSPDGSNTSVLSVSSGEGRAHGAGSFFYQRLGPAASIGDMNSLMRITFADNGDVTGLLNRYTDPNNNYLASLSGSGLLSLVKNVGGASNAIANVLLGGIGTLAGYWIRFLSQGTTHQIRVWSDNGNGATSNEPTTVWHITLTDSGLATGSFGLYGSPNSAGDMFFDSYDVLKV